MRIILDARLYGLENSGIGRYLINLIENLQKIDQDNQYLVLLRKKYFSGLELGGNFEKVLVDVPHYSFSEQFRMPSVLKKLRADLVHFPHFNIPLFWKGRFVVTIHDVTIHFQGRDASKLNLFKYFSKRIIYKVVFKKAVMESLKIIVPTKSVKNDLADYYEVNKKKIGVIYEGVSKLKDSPKAVLVKHGLSKEKYFLYIGTAYPHKNLKKAIDAMVQLNKESKEKIVFVIVSPRNFFTKDMEKYSKSVGAGRFVKFLGFVPDEDLEAIYKNSLSLVFPSKSEGFGLQGLEAIFSGTLVALSNIKVFKEVYGEGVFYFDPESKKSIAKTLRKILEMDESDREKRIRLSKKLLEKYSWEKMAKETLQIYEQIKK